MKNIIIENFEMIKCTDPVKREGAYENLIKLFTDEKNTISLEVRNKYLELLCSDDYLFYNIDKEDPCSCVARSFSVLVIALILSVDKIGQLNSEYLIPNILDYINRESDFRGKDKDLGWIHTMAHLGDLLLFLSLHKGASKGSINAVAQALIRKVIPLKGVCFEYGEDIRLGAGLYYVFIKLGSEFDDCLNLFMEGISNEYPERQNIMSVLRCLHLEFLEDDKTKDIANKIKNILMPELD